LAALRRYMKSTDDKILEESYQYIRATIDDALTHRCRLSGKIGDVVAAVSAGEANRCEFDYRAGVYEADRRQQLCASAV
jgi:hypothetical protein